MSNSSELDGPMDEYDGPLRYQCTTLYKNTVFNLNRYIDCIDLISVHIDHIYIPPSVTVSCHLSKHIQNVSSKKYIKCVHKIGDQMEMLT